MPPSENSIAVNNNNTNNINNNNTPAVVDEYLISASFVWSASCCGRFIPYEMVPFTL